MADEDIQEPEGDAGAPEPEPETQEADPEPQPERLADHNRTYQELIARQQAMIERLATQPKATPQPQRDPTEDLRGKFGEGPEGEEAFRTVMSVSELAAKKASEDTERRLRQEYDGKLQTLVKTMTEGQAAQRHLQEMKSQGRIDDAGINAVKREMAAILEQNPEYNGHPEFTRKMAIANVFERGELVGSKPAPKKAMPGQPAGERGKGRDVNAAAKEEKYRRIDEAVRKFPSLRQYWGKPEEAEKVFGDLADASPEDDEIVTGPGGGQAPRFAVGASFSHTRS